MGWWGYYDDENDTVCDAWYSFLEKMKSQLKWSNDLNVEEYENKLREALVADPKLYNTVAKFVKSAGHDYISTGICLMLTKLVNEKPVQYQPLYGIPPPSDTAINLPENFPEKLREYIIECIESELTMISEGGWKDDIARQKALNHELYIFSRGKSGSNTPKIKNSFEEFFDNDNDDDDKNNDNDS